MRGLLVRTETGVSATLRDRWGYVFTLTGTKAEGGYDIEVVMTGVPADLALPGDEQNFEVIVS